MRRCFGRSHQSIYMKKGQKAADLAPSHHSITDYQRSSVVAERKQLCEVDETKNKLIICM